MWFLRIMKRPRNDSVTLKKRLATTGILRYFLLLCVWEKKSFFAFSSSAPLEASNYIATSKCRVSLKKNLSIHGCENAHSDAFAFMDSETV